MLVNQIEDDAYVAIGKMGSKADAEQLRKFVEVELKKKVAFISPPTFLPIIQVMAMFVAQRRSAMLSFTLRAWPNGPARRAIPAWVKNRY